MESPAGPSTNRQRRTGYLLAALAIVAGTLTAAAVVTGGYRVQLAGIPLSIRGTTRPLMIAVIAATVAFHMLGARHWRISRWVARAAPALLPGAAVVAAVGLFLAGLFHGSTTAGGSDAYGYVSQADLWLRGQLRTPQFFAGHVPWPNPEWTFTPLGYRANDNHELLPTYAPGLPLLMAGAQLFGGLCAQYLIAPLCGAVLVLATYGLGVRLSGRLTGAIAALCAASSPIVLFMTLLPMSDVPAAAFWALSLLLALNAHGIPLAAGAGALAGIAIAIRPNLAPLAVFPAALLAWGINGGTSRVRLRRLLGFGIGCAPFVIGVALIFNAVYGSPLSSGYGDAEDLFRLAHALPNLARYPRWFWETQGLAGCAFLLLPLLLPRDEARRVRWIFLALIVCVLLAYLFYIPHENWTFLRLMLPAFPVLFVLSADVVSRIAARHGQAMRVSALVVFGALAVGASLAESKGRSVLSSAAAEQRYADAGRYLATAVPGNAVIIAMQHSGSARYYSGRTTLRYDMLDPQWLDRAVDFLERARRPVYILLDDWEVAGFADRFRGQASAAITDARPMAATPDRRVVLYGPQRERIEGTVVMPATERCSRRRADQ